MSNKKVIISFGHRNNTGGGAAGEKEWTDDAGRALGKEFTKRGWEVFYVSEHDGDGDHNFTHRGLGAIGGIVEEIDAKFGPVDAYLSIHYGGEPVDGYFGIVPDAGGLRSAATLQWVNHDSWESNTLDVRVAESIAKSMAATKTVPIRGGLKGYGTMSEKQSGVGAQGWRLSELQESIGIKEHAVRIILEYANGASARDRKFLHDMNWVANVASPAIVTGVENVLGKASSKPVPKPVPKPDPEPVPMKGRDVIVRFDVYARHSPGLYDYKNKKDNRIFDHNGKPVLVKAGTKATMIDGPRTLAEEDNKVTYYDLKIEGQGINGSCWVQDNVMHTLDFI